jgi:hypothetical protein
MESVTAIIASRRRAMDGDSFDTLKAYMRLADQLVEHATKEQLGECARILSLNVAHYATRYGELPIEERLEWGDGGNTPR